jgi:tryptophanyl-tRNA synthetase
MTDQAPAPFTGKPRVLSGVQPTGDLHLGNYLGALVKFARLQHEMETFIFVADLHALTEWVDPSKLKSNVREITAAYLATGLNCVARLGWLDRMTQFKDKAGNHKERSSVGLYTYPVLQAADILVYKATHVPVGEDQRQHLELTRDIAAKFNHDFEAPGFFPLPDALTQGPGARIMSLRDGAVKMSKSDPTDNSRINLTDDADTISQKIRKARTDADVLPEKLDDLAGRAEAQNLIGVYAALSGRSAQDVLTEFAGQGFGTFKPKLADLAVSVMGPIGGEMRRLLADPAEIDRILATGAERAREVANPTLAEVKRIVGYWAG